MMENCSKKIPIRLTIKTPFVDRYTFIINYGGTPFWCMFDFAVLLKPESKELDVKLAEGVDNETVKWFPHLQKGIFKGYQKILETERIIVNVCIEIKKIFAHPIDTTAQGCDYYGFSFILFLAKDILTTMDR